jgi:hypothetical protein
MGKRVYFPDQPPALSSPLGRFRFLGRSEKLEFMGQ